MKLVKSLMAAATAVAILGAAPLRRRPSTRDEYRVSTVVPAPFPWGIAAERWAELVAERTDWAHHHADLSRRAARPGRADA